MVAGFGVEVSVAGPVQQPDRFRGPVSISGRLVAFKAPGGLATAALGLSNRVDPRVPGWPQREGTSLLSLRSGTLSPIVSWDDAGDNKMGLQRQARVVPDFLGAAALRDLDYAVPQLPPGRFHIYLLTCRPVQKGPAHGRDV